MKEKLEVFGMNVEERKARQGKASEEEAMTGQSVHWLTQARRRGAEIRGTPLTFLCYPAMDVAAAAPSLCPTTSPASMATSPLLAQIRIITTNTTTTNTTIIGRVISG